MNFNSMFIDNVYNYDWSEYPDWVVVHSYVIPIEKN